MPHLIVNIASLCIGISFIIISNIPHSLKFSWNGNFSNFVDKIFMDCRSIALNYIVGQNFHGYSKSTKIFTLEIFRLYGIGRKN